MSTVQRVRLLGVNCPEKFGGEKTMGMKAKAFVSREVLGENVVVHTEKSDVFGRWLATVEYRDGEGVLCDLASELIRTGNGVAYGGKNEHGRRRSDGKARPMKDDTLVTLHLTYRVLEPDDVITYAKANAEAWGFDEGHFDSEDGLAEAVREIITGGRDVEKTLEFECVNDEYRSHKEN